VFLLFLLYALVFYDLFPFKANKVNGSETAVWNYMKHGEWMIAHRGWHRKNAYRFYTPHNNCQLYISIMKPTWCTCHSIYWESRASTRFEHYLLILRRRCTNGTWYIACVHCNRVTALQLTLYARNIPNAVCVAPPEDEQVMLETRRGPWFSINWMTGTSRWFHYTDILWCTVSKTLSSSSIITWNTLQFFSYVLIRLLTPFYILTL
jgi:hypothetical protein